MTHSNSKNNSNRRTNNRQKHYFLLSTINKKLNAIGNKLKTTKKQNISYSDKSNAKWTDIVNTLVNAVLALFTFLLFKEALRQGDVAEKSANAAIRAVDEAKRSNDIAAKNSKEDSISFATNYDLAQQSLQTQINSVKEAQKQFEILNRPYIQMMDFKPIDFVANGYPKIEYTITNLGNYPAKILSGRMGLMLTDTFRNPFKNINMLGHHHHAAVILTKGEEYRTSYNPKEMINSYHAEKIENETWFIYAWGELEYINELNKKKMIYRFAFRVDQKGRGHDIYVNENTYAK